MFVVANPDVDVAALIVKAFVAPAFHVNVLPFAIVATNTWPKLLNDHSPGSSVISSADDASPQFPAPQVSVPQPYPYDCAAGPTGS